LAGPLLAASLNLAERSSKIFGFNMVSLQWICNAGQCSKIHPALKFHHENSMPHPSGAQGRQYACNWCVNLLLQTHVLFNILVYIDK
jgi:hypothetical protein